MSAEPVPSDNNENDQQAKRTVFILVSAQALGGSIASLNIVVSTLAGAELLDNDAFATLPATFLLFGTMCGTVPASLLSHRFGRRAGFIMGALVGALGGLVAALAIMGGAFAGLLAGTFLTGVSNAFVQQYRFAAADQASDTFRPKAISWVMAGGIVAGVIGPQTAIFTSELVPGAIYAGCYFAQIVLCFLAVPILLTLKIPAPHTDKKTSEAGRPLGFLLTRLPFLTAIICGMFAYSIMSLVMTAAPLAMQGYAHSTADAAIGIQWHVIAMFAPSFVTGNLISRFSAQKIMAAGFVLLSSAVLVGYLDTTVLHFWGSLILLGIGWNFGFVGATTMLAGLYRSEEKGAVQALNDFLVFTGVAIASLSSGVLLELFGWETLLLVAAGPIAFSLMLLAVNGAAQRAVSSTYS